MPWLMRWYWLQASVLAFKVCLWLQYWILSEWLQVRLKDWLTQLMVTKQRLTREGREEITRLEEFIRSQD